jgi:hypothetical protein
MTNIREYMEYKKTKLGSRQTGRERKKSEREQNSVVGHVSSTSSSDGVFGQPNARKQAATF